MPKLVTPSLIFLITIDRFWSMHERARMQEKTHCDNGFGHAGRVGPHTLLHATRYIYYLLIHIDIRTLTIKIKI